MSRPRQFDADAALHQCMEVFWEKGYHGTSYDDLTRTTQVKKQSLYGVFKSKKELFLQSLKLYREQTLELLEERIAAEVSPLRQLEAICDAALFPDAESASRGCLIINSALEFGGEDEDVNREIEWMSSRMQQLIEQTIRSGQEQGIFTARLGSLELAIHLNNAISGAKVMEKSGSSREEIGGVLRTAVSLMQI